MTELAAEDRRDFMTTENKKDLMTRDNLQGGLFNVKQLCQTKSIIEG